MTLETITPDALDRLEKLLADSFAQVVSIRIRAARGEITRRQAAAEINRIAERINKAANP